VTTAATNYELIDTGDYRKLERFGSLIIERPCKQSNFPKKLDDKIWKNAHLNFSQDALNTKGFWAGEQNSQDWIFTYDNLTFCLKITENGQIGIFPEQIDNLEWIRNTVKETSMTANILNGFAYTGLATLSILKHLSMKKDDVTVTHVDASKSAINWAKQNAEINDIKNSPNIKYIQEDMLTFLGREKSRGKKYDGFIFDPPTFGRGKGNKDWKFNTDIFKLIDTSMNLLNPNPLFYILTTHSVSVNTEEIKQYLQSFKKFNKIEDGEMIIKSTKGNSMHSGYYFRLS
jgi:23S rRNA (cytosine1962-C5)-methyltransferase